jgi:hypothetical protein
MKKKLIFLGVVLTGAVITAGIDMLIGVSVDVNHPIVMIIHKTTYMLFGAIIVLMDRKQKS